MYAKQLIKVFENKFLVL